MEWFALLLALAALAVASSSDLRARRLTRRVMELEDVVRSRREAS